MGHTEGQTKCQSFWAINLRPWGSRAKKHVACQQKTRVEFIIMSWNLGCMAQWESTGLSTQ